MSTENSFNPALPPKQAQSTADRRPAGTKHDHPLNKRPPANRPDYGPGPQLSEHVSRPERFSPSDTYGDDAWDDGVAKMHDLSPHLLPGEAS
jgi:hypothetical protein